jgi:hypothetical protein
LALLRCHCWQLLLRFLATVLLLLLQQLATTALISGLSEGLLRLGCLNSCCWQHNSNKHQKLSVSINGHCLFGILLHTSTCNA